MLSEMTDQKFSLSDTPKLSVKVVIDTIKANKTFSKLILYYLNILKSNLTIQNQYQVTENAIFMMNNNFIEIIGETLPNHLDNEDVLIKFGEVLFYIVSSFLGKGREQTSDKDNQLLSAPLSQEFENFQNQHGGVQLIANVINLLPENQIEANKIYLKILQLIIDAVGYTKEESIDLHMILIISLIEKFKNSTDLLIYLLEIIKKISSLKKFKQLVANDESNHVKTSKINLNSFIQTLLNVISSTNSSKIATLGLQILDVILKSIDSRDLVRESKPISFIVKLLSKFKDDTMLSFHACAVLSKIIEREDVCGFLKILQIKNISNFLQNAEAMSSDTEMTGMLTEIRDSLTQVNQNEEAFNSFKKYITRILILMSKDKSFLGLLKDINSLDCFVGLLKSDLEIYSTGKSEKDESSISKEELMFIESLLPEFIKLVMSLLKNYDFDPEDVGEELITVGNSRSSLLTSRTSIAPRDRLSLTRGLSNEESPSDIGNSAEVSKVKAKGLESRQMLKDICYCLFKSLNFFSDQKMIVYEILDFFTTKDRKITEDYLKDFSQNEFDMTCILLLRKYYTYKWVYSFLHKVSIQAYFAKSLTDETTEIPILPHGIFNEDCLNLLSLLESISLIFDDNKKEQIFHYILSLSIKLSLGVTLTPTPKDSILASSNLFNDNSFQEYFNVAYKMVDMLDFISAHDRSSNVNIFSFNSNSKENSNDAIFYLITFIFSAIENKNFGASNADEKCKLLLCLIKKILAFDSASSATQSSSFFQILSYLTMRLTRIIEYKMDSILKILFKHELLCELVLFSLGQRGAERNKMEDSLTKESLLINIHIISTQDGLQISRFLRENGIIFLMKICESGCYDFDISKLLIQNIQIIAHQHFKESAMIFKNFFAFRNFLTALKEIKFSKGINEKIYYELLMLLRQIVKSCEFYEAAEETNLVDHIVHEYNDIYSFYLDTKNRLLEIISDILAMFSKDKHMLKNLLNSNLPEVIEIILKQMSGADMDHDGDGTQIDNAMDPMMSMTGMSMSSSRYVYFSEILLEHFSTIFISFFKSKEYSKLVYSNSSCKNSLIMIKDLIFAFAQRIPDLVKMLSLCELIIEFENSEVTKDKMMTPIYFKELAMKIPSNSSCSSTSVKDMIEKCTMLIENPFSDKIHKTIHDSNTKLIKELYELVKSERKNAVRERRRSREIKDQQSVTISATATATASHEVKKNSFIDERSENEEDKEEEENTEKNVHRRRSAKRSLINISSNPVLQNHFDNIIYNINSVTEIVLEKSLVSSNNIEQECEQLSDLLKMLGIFAKDEENIQKIYDNGVIDKLIEIMENERILTFTQDQGYNLIGKMIECENSISKFFENGRACEFFLKEMNKICKVYYPDSSEYIRNKVYIVSKIISKLSAEKCFVMNNSEYLNIVGLYTMLSTVSCDKHIIMNLLITFNNVIVNSSEKAHMIDTQQMKISELLIHRLWKKFENEIRVLEQLMNIIQSLYLNETLLHELLELDLMENLNKILNISSLSKIDSDGILNVLNLIDTLIFHRYFAGKVIEQKTLTNIAAAATVNMFNTKIIEKCLSLLSKGGRMDKNFITILGLYGINDFCLKILTKYMVTCHAGIIKSTLELMYVLMSDEKNLKYFSQGTNMDIILKTFKINMKSKDQVLLSLKLINVITTKDVEMKVEKTKRKNSVLGGGDLDKKGQSEKNILTSSLKIAPSSMENIEGNIKGIAYDFTILLEIINEILSNYDEHFDIIMQLCELTTNIFNISNEIWLKKFMMDVIVNNADLYISKNKQEYIEIFLQTILQMIKIDKSLLDIDCSSSLFYMNKIISSVKMNYNIIVNILKILKQVARSKNVNSSSNLQEIVKTLSCLQSNTEFHDDIVIHLFSQILGYLCINTSFYKQISHDYMIFLVSYLIQKPTSSVIHIKLLEDLKSISIYFHISDLNACQNVADLLYKTFILNLHDANKKNLMNVFQIISSLCIQSEFMKQALNSNDNNLTNEIKQLVSNDSFDDTLLDYQAKGCLLNLKPKKASTSNSNKLTNSSTIRSMSIYLAQVEVKEEVKVFLTTERYVKIYSDKGEIKKRFMVMNSTLEKIMGYNRGKNNALEITDQMDIKEMDSCVRSCSTAAFSKSRGLFTKKPKPARCFSILGIKAFNKAVQTFNVECEKEDECIKYVDYLSILINNYKSIKDELHDVSPFNQKSVWTDTDLQLNK